MKESDYYAALLQEKAGLERKVQYLESVVEAHHITKFDENIHKLQLDIRSGCRLLAAEFLYMEHDEKTMGQIRSLVRYLTAVIRQLEQFLHDERGKQ